MGERVAASEDLKRTFCNGDGVSPAARVVGVSVLLEEVRCHMFFVQCDNQAAAGKTFESDTVADLEAVVEEGDFCWFAIGR